MVKAKNPMERVRSRTYQLPPDIDEWMQENVADGARSAWVVDAIRRKMNGES